ncbi:MAG: carbohydrate ABC transporter permease [Candidatus Limnocylindrales bacterium]|jgi:ABC-type glycerol-3-phosphate transport system permease component
MIVPFVWMILNSFKTAEEILRKPPTFLPTAPTIENYVRLVVDFNFLQFVLNSLLVTGSVTICVVATSALLGYVFAKTRFVGRDVIFWAFLATMALPFEVLAVPLLLMARSVGAVDQLWGLVVPFSLDAFAIYICRQYMMSIPDDYLDAGRVDGLGQFGLFRHIVLPMSRPAIAAVAILSFLYNWDQLFWPLVLITSDSNKTVPLGIVSLSTQFGPIYDLTMAASTVTIVPLLLVFLVFRRQFIQGMMMSGLKG